MMKPQLFLLHFAGGSVYSFQFLKPLLDEFEFIPLELPGRGRRTKEIMLRDFVSAADDIARQILHRVNGQPFMIYGHSMGAILAVKVAALLENTGKFAVALVISGNAGPGTNESKKRYLLEKEAFKEELKVIGGMPEEVLNDDELLDYFTPLLKADFEIAEKDPYSTLVPVKAPLHVMMGSEEESVDEIENWKPLSLSQYSSIILNGNHFFIYNQTEAIASEIKTIFQRYKTITFQPPPA